jgi:DNA primase
MTVSVWNEIQNKLNIVDVIADYIPVKQMGSTYKAVCPFHKDKNPSLIISVEKNLWHCFGCGAGGDLFAFVSQYENIDKASSLKKLAKKAGVELPTLNQKERIENKQELTNFELGLKYLDWVGNIYHKILLKILNTRSHPVSQYCLERGLTIETIEKFKLGYAFNQNTVLDLAKKHNLSLDLLEQISVLKTSTQGKQDKFKDRLTIPIFDSLNKIRGFTARVLPYDKSERPKYLNSTQSDWFNKSELWYGLNFNQKAIRVAKKAILVEGNMDVIAASQKNLNITLASQGTSFTTEQLKILNRLVKTIWLAFDNDEAGRISSNKLFLESSKLGFEIYKLVIPKKYKDLDEYLNTDFPQKVDYETDLKTMPYLDYAINENLLELQSQELQIQKNTITKILELLEFSDKITVEDVIQKMSKITAKSVNAIESLLPKNNYKNTKNDNFKESISEHTNHNEFLVRYQNLISLIAKESDFKFSSIPKSKLVTLNNLFLICSNLLPELSSFKNFEDYFNQNVELLKLIVESITTSKIVFIKALRLNINSFVQNILFEENLSLAYQEIQQNLSGL